MNRLAFHQSARPLSPDTYAAAYGAGGGECDAGRCGVWATCPRGAVVLIHRGPGARTADVPACRECADAVRRLLVEDYGVTWPGEVPIAGGAGC